MWAASPRRTTGVAEVAPGAVTSALHCAQATVGKVRQMERLAIRRWPRRKSPKRDSQIGDGRGLVGVDETGGAPGGVRALDDPGRHRFVVRVGVDLEEAGRALLEEEGEGVERARGAEPAEAGAAVFDPRRDGVGELAAGKAVDAVGGDEDVVAVRGELGERREVALEAERHAELAAALLQDGEQRAPRQRGEAVAARHRAGAAVEGVDGVPAPEAGGDRAVARGIGVAKGAQGLVGEDDAEAVGVVGAVAFDDRHRGVGHRLAQQQRAVEAAGAAAEHSHSQAQLALQSSRKRRASCGPRPSSSCFMKTKARSQPWSRMRAAQSRSAASS